ncbi:MAG: right-handed parallel beta-helix repeat-containing protein [bacterium]
MNKLKNALGKQKIEVIGAVMLLAICVLPFLTFASSRKGIYVDASAKGSENGSASSPYHTISKALDNADDRIDIHVAKGEYRENITIEKGIQVFGSAAGDVVIRPASKNKPVVTMKHNTEINKVTIEKGDDGVLVREDAKASIIEVVIKNNTGDGVKIEKGDVKDKFRVSISDSTIIDNGGSGIFSQKRRLSIINNDVVNNGKDGIDLYGGTSAWMEKNSIRNNDKSGLKLTLDGSEIWTKNNTIKGNSGQGVEVNAWGGVGRIDLNKSKITDNKKFAVARNARVSFGASIWNGLTVQKNTDFKDNKSGNISGINLLR